MEVAGMKFCNGTLSIIKNRDYKKEGERMKISQFIKVLENVKKEVGDLPICLPDGLNEISCLMFDYEFDRIGMSSIADSDESTTSILRKIDRKIVS
jgi:hypothetical protein